MKMELSSLILQFAFLAALCFADTEGIFKRLAGYRVKRHTILDQSKLCRTFGCLNGFCKESEMRKYRIVCECFPGYEGKLCDRLKCPFSCGSYGRCARKGRTLYCKCNSGYSGPRCESPAVQVHPVHAVIPQSVLKPLNGHVEGDMIKVNEPAGWFAHAVTPKDMKFSDFHSHAVIDTNVKPDVCAPGFQCYHGVCNRKSLAYGRFQCICKKNYMGLFCEKKCTLNCQNGGKCFVKYDGHQVCFCPFDHTGHYCEKKIRKG